MGEPIYLGRIVAVGRNRDGKCAAMYRVSSRSFPNRRALLADDGASIVPKEGHESDVFKSPYIAYTCAGVSGATAVVSNGSHTDPILEKVDAGMPIRDAMALTLLALDYEHDQLDTPRIAAAIEADASTGWLGVVRKDGLHVRELAIAPGTCYYVSTYEHNEVRVEQTDAFACESAEACCDTILAEGRFADFQNPVTAVAAFETDGGFAFAAHDMG